MQKFRDTVATVCLSAWLTRSRPNVLGSSHESGAGNLSPERERDRDVSARPPPSPQLPRLSRSCLQTRLSHFCSRGTPGNGGRSCSFVNSRSDSPQPDSTLRGRGTFCLVHCCICSVPHKAWPPSGPKTISRISKWLYTDVNSEASFPFARLTRHLPRELCDLQGPRVGFK